MYLLRLASNDLRLILRDGMLAFFLAMPLLLVLVVRFGVAALTAQFPIVAAYHGPIAMAAGLQTALLAGFVSSFLFLEEKDEQVLAVLRILPITTFRFVVYRLLFATLFAGLGSGIVLVGGGVAYPGTALLPGLILLYGLTAPLITLIIATIAANKIEGMAYFKIVNLVLLLPLTYFFLPEWVGYAFSWIPTYWLFRLYERALEEGPTIGILGLALGVYLFWLAIFYRRFARGVMGRTNGS